MTRISFALCIVGMLAVAVATTPQAWSGASLWLAGPAQTSTGGTGGMATLKGTIKDEGDKVIFVNDKDGKTWEVMNPEELKGHDGHHVQVSAHVYADKNSIQVMSVKMVKGDAMKDDSK